MKRLISLVLALSCLLTLTVPASAADNATGTTLRLEETKGTVTVKTASGESKSIVKSMRLYNGYSVATGASSSAYIGLDDTKAVQLDSSGMVEIKKQGKKLEVSLTSGQLYFNVTEPLKTDESLNIRTATMVTGIRGSFGWVTSTEMGLMHGHVTLTCTNPETGETRVTEVYSGEKVTFEAATQETAADPTLLEIDFVKEEIVNDDVPAIVVEAVKNDETLQQQLTEDVESIDVPELIGSLETKQAEEKEAEEAAQAQVETALAAQETAIAEEAAAEQAIGMSDGTAQEYVFETPAPAPADDDSGDDTPTTYTVTDATQLGAALSANDDVTFTGTGTASNLSIADGKTLTIASGANLTLGGTSENLSNHTLINNGTLTISGTFNNGGATAGRFVNNGTLTINKGASFVNKANGIFSGSKSFTGDGTGDGTLKFTVTFNTDGGSAVAAQEVEYNDYATAVESTKTDYTFGGWYRDASLSTVWSPGTDAITDNLTVYAKWTASSLSGSVNSDVTWALTENGTLSGGGTAYQLSFALASGSTTGFISDYDDASTRPWVNYAASINDVSIGAGITIIGRSACSGFTALTSVTIPRGVCALSSNAFSGCSSLSSVTIQGDLRGNGNGVGDFAFYGCASNLNVEFTNSTELALLGRNKSSGTAHLAIGNSAFDAGTTLTVGDNTVTAVRGTVGSIDATSPAGALGDGTTYSYSSVCADRIDTTGDVQLYVQSTGTANEIVNYYNGY